jgi:hypothetical protein
VQYSYGVSSKGKSYFGSKSGAVYLHLTAFENTGLLGYLRIIFVCYKSQRYHKSRRSQRQSARRLQSDFGFNGATDGATLVFTTLLQLETVLWCCSKELRLLVYHLQHVLVQVLQKTCLSLLCTQDQCLAVVLKWMQR